MADIHPHDDKKVHQDEADDGIGPDSRRVSSRRSLSFTGRSGRKSGLGGLGATENVFQTSKSRSEAEFDDEEALKWAALERLPTYDRLRTTVLEGEGKKDAVDLRSLDKGTLRTELLQKLFLESTESDSNIIFLQKLRQRIDRVGVTLPTVEVRYKDLTVKAQAHLGGRALPTLWNAAVNAVEGALTTVGINLMKKTDITILRNVNGIIKPGRMTLLLGPPSSGKTTLLLALAGKLDKNLQVSGEITYNGYKLDEFVPQKTSAYVNQNDLHVPQMTVRESFEYSAKSQDVGENRYDLLTELHKREKELGIHPDSVVDYYMKANAMKETSSTVATDYILRILGLDICADTMIGDEMVRGISGGQKKRVTTGEMIVGPMKTLFMDEISTGLDSSTTFQIVQYLRDITHVLESTVFISLLQPAPETFDLFDDVILLSEGQIVYHGPKDQVLNFFRTCGFTIPERKGIADFLQEVTSRKDQEQYWMDKSKPYRFVPVQEFSNAFGKFNDGAAMSKELEIPFDKSRSHDGALQFDKFTLPRWEMLKNSLDKEILLVKRNAFIYVFKTVQMCISACIACATFLRPRMPRNNLDDAQIYSGALFFGVSNLLFNGYAELALMIARLPVFYRQRDALFFPPWCFSLAVWLLSVPISAVETILWTGITYYVIGFSPAVTRFFRQLLVFFLTHQMSASLFRIIAGVCRSMVVSNTGGTFVLVVVFTMGGFLIRRTDIKPWWIWGYWISPLTYAQNAVSVNEFLAPRWNKLSNGETQGLGYRYLKQSGIFPHHYWYWIGVAGLLVSVVLFNFIFTLTLMFFNPLGRAQASLSEEQQAEQHANLTGEILPSFSKSRSRSGARSFRRSLSNKTGTQSTVRKSGLSTMREGEINDGSELSDKASQPSFGGDNADLADARARASRLYSKSRNSMEEDDANGVAPKRGMVLPFKPLSMSFDDVKYFVDMPSQMKAQGATESKLQLLRGITGAFRPGVLTALVGVSGAGKTTLMDVLAGRKTGGYIEGDIRIAGFPKKQETFARISGYCEQTDIHSPQVTVEESLTYSAWLRLGKDVGDEDKGLFVEEVMDLVELTSLKGALVGLPGETGLSTEQRKRLTVAVELVANPSIIFMDEPTSGLDARAAAIVMRTVRNTVDTGRTVVCTIHQPSIDIFEAFDDLLLLKRGGQVIYAGSLGRHSHKLIEFFQAVPGVPKIKDGSNPATWMLEISTPNTEQRLGVDFADVYANSALFKRNKAMVQELSHPKDGEEDLWFPTQYSQPFWSQVTSCLWKQHLNYWRSPSYNNVRYLFAILAAILFGTLFWQVGNKRDTQSGLAATAGALVAAILFVGINNAATVQPVVATERTVYYRERAAGLYSAAPYAIAQVLIELPYILVLTLIYGLITYACMGLEWTAAKFWWYIYFMFFAFLYFTYYGMMAVSITPNHQIASVVAAFFYQIFNIFSGYLITRPRAPKWVSWYFWASPTAWTLYGLVISQLGNVHDPLQEVSSGKPTTVSNYVHSFFGFKNSFLVFAALMHVFWAGLFAFVFLLAIKFLNFQNR